MKRVLVVLTVLLVYYVGCTPYMKKMKETKEVTDDASTATQSAANQRTAPARLTYLDTLNRGKEIRLSESDLANNSLQVSENQVGPASVAHYRIQLFASSRIETLREQKKELEPKLNLPMFIAYEAPYYKLLAGDFMQRSEAEAQLTKLKKSGFPDAWIVTSKIAGN